MKKINCIFAVLMVAMLPVVAMAQSESVDSKWQFEVGYQYSLGLSARSNGETIHRSDVKMYGNAIRVSALYNINKRFSAGLGLSSVGYEPSPNSLPLYATFRYRPLDGKWNHLYAFTNLGYSFGKSGSEDLCSGFVGELGMGWSKMFRRHFGLNFQVSYSLNQFRKLNYLSGFYDGPDSKDPNKYVEPEVLEKYDIWRNSLSFSVGIVF